MNIKESERAERKIKKIISVYTISKPDGFRERFFTEFVTIIGELLVSCLLRVRKLSG